MPCLYLRREDRVAPPRDGRHPLPILSTYLPGSVGQDSAIAWSGTEALSTRRAKFVKSAAILGTDYVVLEGQQMCRRLDKDFICHRDFAMLFLLSMLAMWCQTGGLCSYRHQICRCDPSFDGSFC